MADRAIASAGSAKTALARYLPDARTIVARALNSVPVAGTLCITHPIAKLDGAACADTRKRCADTFFCRNVQRRAGARRVLVADFSTLVADFGKEAKRRLSSVVRGNPRNSCVPRSKVLSKASP